MSVINQIAATKDRIVEVIRIDATHLPDECIADMNQLIDDYTTISAIKMQLVLYKLNEKISTSINSIAQVITEYDMQIPTAVHDKKFISYAKCTSARFACSVYIGHDSTANWQLVVDACNAIGIDVQPFYYDHMDEIQYIFKQIYVVSKNLININTDLDQANAEVTLQTLQINRDQKADQFNHRTTELIALLQIPQTPQTPQTPQNKQREKITRYKRTIVKALRYNRSYMDIKEKTLELLETYWSDTNAQHTVVEFDSTFNNYDEEIAHFEMMCDHYIESQNVDNSDAESVSGFSMASITSYI